ncbi:hypothetical protein KHQ06_09070 [Nocardia tengchongensis]|uniref:Uncharacterized protein n=1 Tax=Nocardia tengchongensis TaxID=2055889 RepID=A0ABX8CT10_9NOCA|nr:hypothetical protein [Nocardia tengchongensis]QVI23060.1 hypothetical protein KHQ06_09070 [Nocardia tengchongensis]
MSKIPLGGRHLGAGLAVLAIATGAASVLATHQAPEAHATVDSITISGSNWTVGQTYTLSADLSGASFGLLVYWEDNGNAITSPASKVPWPPYHSSTDWTPTTPGQHNITLKQGSSTKSLVVNVGSGVTTTTRAADHHDHGPPDDDHDGPADDHHHGAADHDHHGPPDHHHRTAHHHDDGSAHHHDRAADDHHGPADHDHGAADDHDGSDDDHHGAADDDHHGSDHHDDDSADHHHARAQRRRYR